MQTRLLVRIVQYWTLLHPVLCYVVLWILCSQIYDFFDESRISSGRTPFVQTLRLPALWRDFKSRHNAGVDISKNIDFRAIT